jgi:putative tributyrin esterase
MGAPNSPERAAHDPFQLIEKIPYAQLPMIYIAVGGQDFLLAENRAFVQLLAEKKIPYEYREVSPRVHEWDFWDEQIQVFLSKLDELRGFAPR